MRLFALVFVGLATAISVNALYLQDARYAAGGANMAAQQDAAPRGATAALPSAEPPKTGTAETAPAPAASVKAAPRPRLPRAEPKRAPEQLAAAIRRELSRNGYDTGASSADSDSDLRAAILAFEFDQQLAMTGEVSEAILKPLLFAGGGKGDGAPERFENRRRLVAEVQEMLSGLGYGSGPADGRIDERTREAIRKFETDRNLNEGGKLTARMLLEMVIVSGRPFAANG